MEHFEGSKIGLRGLIAAENYKLLLLVNSKSITNMVYEGALVELDLWDMADIERIEVVRGAGSVTYGTGAIAGVINIITKNANSDLPVSSISLSKNDAFNSRGINAQFSKRFGNVKTYSYASYRKTEGLLNPNYFGLNGDASTDIRYQGKRDSDTTGPQDYLADSLGRPQIKAHLDIAIGKNVSTWARYTQSGQTHTKTSKKILQDANGDETGEQVNQRKVSLRSFMWSGDYKSILNENSFIKYSATYDSQEYIRYFVRNVDYDPEGVHNIRHYAFSQNRATVSILYNFHNEQGLNLVAGYEYTNIAVNSPWGTGDDELWIQEGIDIISDVDTSVYLQDPNDEIGGKPKLTGIEEVGSGMYFQTHSHLLEATYKLSDSMRLLYAHRIDFPDVSDTMFAPRLSLLTKFNNDNSMVITAQRALRMMPLRAQYLVDKYDEKDQHESLDAFEVSYTNLSFDNTVLTTRTFYNNTHAVGYTGNHLEFLADVETIGLELEGEFKFGNHHLMVNHSYLEPIYVSMNEDLKTGGNKNNISFADYYYDSRGDYPDILEGEGNGLNNWATSSTKIVLSSTFMNKQLRTMLSTQIFWDYDGSYDEMEMYQSAYDRFDTTGLTAEQVTEFEDQKAMFEHERELWDAEDGFKLDYSVNLSVSYSWNKFSDYLLTASFFANNIIKSKKTYFTSTGSRNFYPDRFIFYETPRVLGVNIKMDIN